MLVIVAAAAAFAMSAGRAVRTKRRGRRAS
jgi:hypothetical protein